MTKRRSVLASDMPHSVVFAVFCITGAIILLLHAVLYASAFVADKVYILYCSDPIGMAAADHPSMHLHGVCV